MLRKKTVIPAWWIIAATLLAGAVTVQAAPTWPSSWNQIQQGGSALADPDDSFNSKLDIVGSTSYPAGYWAEDISSITDDYVMFRFRIDDGGSSSNNAYWVLLNLDADTDVDWALVVDQGNSHSQVEFTQATTGGSLYSNVALSSTPAWTGALSTYSNWVDSGSSNFGTSSNDYFLDVAVPWLYLYRIGLRPGDSFSMALATSTGDTKLSNGDLPLSLGSSSNVSGGWSDSISFSTEHSPEPATLALFGLGLAGSYLARRRLRASRHKAAGPRC